VRQLVPAAGADRWGCRVRASLLKRVPLAQAELRQLRDDIAPTWLRAPLSVEATAERYVRPQLRQARRTGPSGVAGLLLYACLQHSRLSGAARLRASAPAAAVPPVGSHV
jgi:hypothetical protein